MSKAASKVIKAERLNLSLPFSLQGLCLNFDPAGEDQVVNEFAASMVEFPARDKLNNMELPDQAEQPQDQEGSVQREAATILAETEEMVKALLSTAREQAENQLQQAKEEAESLVLGAREDVEALKEQAKQQGYREGYTQALAEARAEAEAIREEARQVLAAANEERARIMAGAEGEMVKLALAVAEKVIREELAIRPELVAIMVQEALTRATDPEEITVKVNPEDLDYVLSIKEELRKENQGVRKLKIVSDGIISRGGCIVETANGTVDARVERQLAEIREALMEVS